jgi:hypothetical protein
MIRLGGPLWEGAKPVSPRGRWRQPANAPSPAGAPQESWPGGDGSRRLATHTRHLPRHTHRMPSDRYLPTLYKARRVPTKQAVCAVCAICVERMRGKTRLVELGYGVSVHLCEGHGSREFQTQRSGRDFVLTLQRLWQAHGCLSVARSNALRPPRRLFGRRGATAAGLLLVAGAARDGRGRLRRRRARRDRHRRAPPDPRERRSASTQHQNHAPLARRTPLARARPVSATTPRAS